MFYYYLWAPFVTISSLVFRENVLKPSRCTGNCRLEPSRGNEFNSRLKGTTLLKNEAGIPSVGGLFYHTSWSGDFFLIFWRHDWQKCARVHLFVARAVCYKKARLSQVSANPDESRYYSAIASNDAFNTFEGRPMSVLEFLHARGSRVPCITRNF